MPANEENEATNEMRAVRVGNRRFQQVEEERVFYEHTSAFQWSANFIFQNEWNFRCFSSFWLIRIWKQVNLES